MRAACVALLALLQYSALARAQNCTTDTDLQILYKTFAQNLGAFNVFLDLIPNPSQARVKTLYSAWLDRNEEQQVTTLDFASTSQAAELISTLISVSVYNITCNATYIPESMNGSAPAPVAASGPSTGATVEGGSSKKGAGMVYFGNVSTALGSAGLSWTYNWEFALAPGSSLPPGTQYVPMIWKASDATPANVAIAKQSGSGVLLGFNEPDLPAQSDNSVSEAIAAWPTLQASGLRLGSPATSIAQDGTQSGSWIGQFMQQVSSNNLKVDFMAVHWYGQNKYFSDPSGATQALHDYLQGYYKAYGRSLWLTEFALADFGGPSNGWAWTFATYDQQLAFMKQAVPMLNGLSFMERYAWFMLAPDQQYDGQNGLPLDTASLYYVNGSATPTGLAYQSL